MLLVDFLFFSHHAVKIASPSKHTFQEANIKAEDIDFLSQSAFDDACRPGNPRDTSVAEITELYLSLM